jgi:hypothetical protein
VVLKCFQIHGFFDDLIVVWNFFFFNWMLERPGLRIRKRTGVFKITDLCLVNWSIIFRQLAFKLVPLGLSLSCLYSSSDHVDSEIPFKPRIRDKISESELTY